MGWPQLVIHRYAAAQHVIDPKLPYMVAATLTGLLMLDMVSCAGLNSPKDNGQSTASLPLGYSSGSPRIGQQVM